MTQEAAMRIVGIMQDINYYEEKLSILKMADEQKADAVLHYTNPLNSKETLYEFLPISSHVIILVERYYRDKIKELKKELEKY